jgi:benzoyl-CoA reductase/2-hydroxyglutaryl-CoA dehydratase subunit BcrC/BadD/HgdB
MSEESIGYVLNELEKLLTRLEESTEDELNYLELKYTLKRVIRSYIRYIEIVPPQGELRLLKLPF